MQLCRDTNKPKRPLTSYIIFALEESKKLQKTPIEISLHLKEKWASLSVKEKEKYQALANEAKRKYEEELANWEKKMQQEGKQFLVRKNVKGIDTAPSRFVRKSTKST